MPGKAWRVLRTVLGLPWGLSEPCSAKRLSEALEAVGGSRAMLSYLGPSGCCLGASARPPGTILGVRGGSGGGGEGKTEKEEEEEEEEEEDGEEEEEEEGEEEEDEEEEEEEEECGTRMIMRIREEAGKEQGRNGR
eukprot:401114-Pyramimonas_sp.AAC.1